MTFETLMTILITIFYNLTFKEQPQLPVTFETFDQSNYETRPDQHVDNFGQFLSLNLFWQFDNHDNFGICWQFCLYWPILDKDINQDHPRDLWPLTHLIKVMKKHDLTNMLTIFDHFDNIWQFLQLFTTFDDYYNVDNLWQLTTIVTILIFFMILTISKRTQL